jgi:hypothetical protein
LHLLWDYSCDYEKAKRLKTILEKLGVEEKAKEIFDTAGQPAGKQDGISKRNGVAVFRFCGGQVIIAR